MTTQPIQTIKATSGNPDVIRDLHRGILKLLMTLEADAKDISYQRAVAAAIHTVRIVQAAK